MASKGHLEPEDTGKIYITPQLLDCLDKREGKFLSWLDDNDIKYQEVTSDVADADLYDILRVEDGVRSTKDKSKQKWIWITGSDIKKHEKTLDCLQIKASDHLRIVSSMQKKVDDHFLIVRLMRTRVDDLTANVDGLTHQLGDMRLMMAHRPEDDLIANVDDLTRQLREMRLMMGHMEHDFAANVDELTRQLGEKAEIAVPPSQAQEQQHRFGILKKSPKYVFKGETDPDYAQYAHYVAFRRRAKTFRARINEIRGWGDGTNREAEMLVEFDTPNAFNILDRLKERGSNMFTFKHGGITLNENVTGEQLQALAVQVNEEKYNP